MPRADSLYGLEHSDDQMGQESYPNYLDLRDRSHGFESLVAWNISQAGIDTGGYSSRAWVTAASGNYFDALGIQPFIGRTFHAGDEHGLNSAPYIVLGYDYWHSHFQDDRSVLGRVIQINKHPFTVIGVAPPGFRGTLLFFDPDFYVPIVNQPQVNSEFDLNTRGINWIFETMGHLKPPWAISSPESRRGRPRPISTPSPRISAKHTQSTTVGCSLSSLAPACMATTWASRCWDF